MTQRWPGILLLIFAAHAYGAEMLPFAPSAAEMMLLPEYCKVRATDDSRSPEFRAWLDRVGTKFMGIHHYCAGLNYINRYLRLVNDEKRGYYLSRAVPEIDYVAKDMPADFPLAGEIFLNRGIANKLMGNDGAASIDFTRAIERDPKQVRAYLSLAGLYMQESSKAKALDLVTTGLKRVPESKALQRKYLELGGKEPFPDADPIPEGLSAKAGKGDTQQDMTQPSGATASEIKSMAVSDQSNAGQSREKSDNNSGDEKVKQPAIGSPTNPYCRFCPDLTTPEKTSPTQ